MYLNTAGRFTLIRDSMKEVQDGKTVIGILGCLTPETITEKQIEHIVKFYGASNRPYEVVADYSLKSNPSGMKFNGFIVVDSPKEDWKNE